MEKVIANPRVREWFLLVADVVRSWRARSSHMPPLGRGGRFETARFSSRTLPGFCLSFRPPINYAVSRPVGIGLLSLYSTCTTVGEATNPVTSHWVPVTGHRCWVVAKIPVLGIKSYRADSLRVPGHKLRHRTLFPFFSHALGSRSNDVLS